MRQTLAAAFTLGFGLFAVATLTGQLPLRQNLEILKEGPIRADRVKDGLYVIRGPFLPCMTGCRPGQTGDGLIHESGDVAVRVTPAGLIVVDDKFASQAAEVLTQIKAVSPLPIRYLLNSHHHGDHASGNQYLRDALGVDIVAHKNIRANFLRIKQAGEPVIDGMPVIDYPGGGSAIEFLTTIDRLLALDFDTMIPGHGKLMTKDD